MFAPVLLVHMNVATKECCFQKHACNNDIPKPHPFVQTPVRPGDRQCCKRMNSVYQLKKHWWLTHSSIVISSNSCVADWLPHATFGLFMFSKTIVGKQNVANLEGPSNFQPAAVQSGNDDAWCISFSFASINDWCHTFWRVTEANKFVQFW